MLKKIADNQDRQSLAVQFRKKRFAFFKSLLSNEKRPIHILDIGGTETYWKMMELKEDDEIFITLLNLSTDRTTQSNIRTIVGDARRIDAGDKTFDVVFSNSVIEHVGTYSDQMQMAQEVKRVGQRYFVQTPNKFFPIEPHFLFPFFQFFPIMVRVQLLRNFNLGWFQKIPDAVQAKREVENIRLLSKRDFMRLFSDARIYEEKVLGVTKSFVAYAGWNPLEQGS
jgi:ubiquinone/menaquinone biosynthesis C-methylase UbiE